MLLDFVSQLVGGDHPDHTLGLGQIAARATIMYLAAVIMVRVGKSRLLTRVTPVDGILTFLLGAILGAAILGTAPITRAVAAIATLVTLHWICTAIAFHSKLWGNLFKGHSYVLVSEGRIHWNNMRRSHISTDDLLEELRLNANINDLEEVQLAVKERSGSVGAVKRRPEDLQFEIDVKDGVQTVRVILGSNTVQKQVGRQEVTN